MSSAKCISICVLPGTEMAPWAGAYALTTGGVASMLKEYTPCTTVCSGFRYRSTIAPAGLCTEYCTVTASLRAPSSLRAAAGSIVTTFAAKLT